MKITNIDTFIEEFRNGRDIWSRASIELAVREIERLRKENNKLKVRLEASESDLVLYEVSEILKKTQTRVQELEQERRVCCTEDGEFPDMFADVLIEINSDDVRLGYLCEKEDTWSIWGFYDSKSPKVGYELDTPIYWQSVVTSLKDEYERQKEEE